MTITYTDMIAMFGIGGAHPGGLGITKQIIKKVNKENLNVLDVGCGTGQTLLYFATHTGGHITGIDLNPVMLAKARERIKGQPNIKLLKANAEALPFKDNAFDVVISESVTTFTNINKSLREYMRVLKHKGILVLLEMTSNQTLSHDAMEEIKQFYQVPSVFTEQEWIDNLAAIGFKNVIVEPISSQSEAVIDFDLNESINPSYFNLMANHYSLTEKYKDSLSARLYYCEK
ncbi:methyltransferase [Paraliobacillus quinghaiensis]|uniref:Methyltransferase n=1 Tax=Paraliobacillus quinghaiensis TaxID=470815 RepID=A0A917WYS4_9BACI|nr:class I SAM-dependent methyltransferase [Paraliobacillus quinghaiensis]GGM41959.1 methyltransferase [Paraliobacillus quinghaiensis]